MEKKTDRSIRKESCLICAIFNIYHWSLGRYGSPRIARELEAKGIGWSLSETMKAQDTSIAALKMARLHRPLQDHDNRIFHLDRGIQYACTEFTSIVAKKH